MGRSDEFKEDRRFVQANREAVFAVVLALLYFAWWYVSAYGLGSGPVEEYKYILGMPAWFVASCIGGFLIFSLLAWVMVRFLFEDLSLEDTERESGGERR